MPGRGFASLSDEEKRRIAGEGGRKAHALGKAHKFTREEAVIAGRKGAAKRLEKRFHEFQVRDEDVLEAMEGPTHLATIIRKMNAAEWCDWCPHYGGDEMPVCSSSAGILTSTLRRLIAKGRVRRVDWGTYEKVTKQGVLTNGQATDRQEQRPAATDAGASATAEADRGAGAAGSFIGAAGVWLEGALAGPSGPAGGEGGSS